jgi:transcription elongation factor Elf1
MAQGSDDDDDDDGPRLKPGATQFFEFDCPECNANNPWPDGFKHKDEVLCHYCGSAFDVRVTDEGKLKLKS